MESISFLNPHDINYYNIFQQTFLIDKQLFSSSYNYHNNNINNNQQNNCYCSSYNLFNLFQQTKKKIHPFPSNI